MTREEIDAIIDRHPHILRKLGVEPDKVYRSALVGVEYTGRELVYEEFAKREARRFMESYFSETVTAPRPGIVERQRLKYYSEW